MRLRTAMAWSLAALLSAGASSSALAATLTVTKTVDTNDGVCDADCSLREAVAAANVAAGADTIVLDSGVTYALTLGPIVVTDAVSIAGNGSTVSAGSASRVFEFNGNFDATISNLTITAGVASGFLSLGGGMRIRNARVTLDHCVVSGNATALEAGARDDGGGIAVIGSFDAPTGTPTLAQLTLTSSTVTGNHGLNGGGILCALCTLTVTNSTISSNVADRDGGGIDLLGNASSISMTGSNLVNNNSAGRGGALAIPFGTSTSALNLNRIVGNTAGSGSAMFNNVATVNIDDNWWGCNYGPGASGANCVGFTNGTSGTFAISRYLVLNAGAAPASLHPGQTSTITADLTKNNLSTDTSAGGAIPDGTVATFAATGATFVSPSAQTSGGKATDDLTSTTAGTAAITVKVDGQTVPLSMTVYPPWTDDPLVPGVTFIKTVHITELRSRIDALRATWSLGAYPYTDPTLTGGTTFVQAQHILDLRAALADVYAAAGLAPPAYTDASLAAGSFVKAIDISELRDAVVARE